MDVRLALLVAAAFELLAKKFQALERLANQRGIQKGAPVEAMYFKILVIQTAHNDLALFSPISDQRQQSCKRQRARRTAKVWKSVPLSAWFSLS